MTDAEIIKALECIASKENVLCDSCPNKKFHLLECHRQGAKNALDLINRQKAEIERLKKGWKADVIETENTKAEAVKEFAERLKEEACGNDLYDRSGRPVKAVTIADVDNVKKEMWG